MTNVCECCGQKLPKKENRTLTQNAAMHVYFELLALAFNDAGFDMKEILKDDVDIPWSKDSVKEFIWKPIQKAMTKKESTTDINTVNPSEIYNVISKHFSQTRGVYVPWPSKR